MDVDADFSSLSVDTVFYEFFDDGSWSFDDFSCFESVDDDIG
jgi:hypothetical protein